jgi:hypothetical protein
MSHGFINAAMPQNGTAVKGASGRQVMVVLWIMESPEGGNQKVF